MNNHILFKALPFNSHEWIYGLPCYLTEYAKDFKEIDGIQCDKTREHYDINPETLCMGCVVYDTLFFENDIFEGNNKHTYIIKFENGAFYAYHTELKDYDGKPLRWGGVWRFNEVGIDVKLIGNKHEHYE